MLITIIHEGGLLPLDLEGDLWKIAVLGPGAAARDHYYYLLTLLFLCYLTVTIMITYSFTTIIMITTIIAVIRIIINSFYHDYQDTDLMWAGSVYSGGGSSHVSAPRAVSVLEDVYTYIYIYMYMYVCMYVCVCICIYIYIYTYIHTYVCMPHI